MTAAAASPGLAHEVRTRVSTIMGFAQLMSDGRAGPVTAEQEEYLADIAEAARQLLEYVGRTRGPVLGDDHGA